ncbi:hypothetical protein [Lacisediminihabitans sp.]|uniref:hypothetical protein n=1 Tax=Lacisediminihabitans sp. TaxID=2787631 RepID=UPI002F922724
MKVAALLGGLLEVAVGLLWILGRRRIASNLPAARKPSWRVSPGSVAAVGAIFVCLGLFLIGFWGFLIS